MSKFLKNLINNYNFLICFTFLFSQLLTVRFFFTSKYIYYDRFFSWIIYTLLSSSFLFIIIKNKKILFIFTHRYTFRLLIFILFFLLLILYPIADSQKFIGMGIDQDDCIINFIENLKQKKFPYSLTYLGNPCSTGVIELLFYFPILFWKNYFSIIPIFSLIIFYNMVKVLTNHINATLFTFFQLTNLLFLEMSSAGSDFILIAVCYPLGLFLAYEGFNKSKDNLLIFALIFLSFFYGSRIILFFLLPLNLFLFYAKFGSRVLKLFLFIFLFVFFSYFIPWVINPEMFTPFHLLKKGFYLISFIKYYVLIFLLIVFIIFNIFDLKKIFFIYIKNNVILLNLFCYIFPIFFISFSDLIETNLPSKWEGLNYFLLIIPSIYLSINLYFSSLFKINKHFFNKL